MPRPRKPANPAEALVGVAPLAARWIERLLASGEPPLTLAQYLALRAIASSARWRAPVGSGASRSLPTAGGTY
jgi:hypothetical protein